MGDHVFSRRRIKRLLTVGVAAATLAGGSLALGTPPAGALTSNLGYACGFWSNISFGGGAYGTQGCGTQSSIYATANSASPSVTLPSSGAATTLTDFDGAKAMYGPSTVFSSPYDANDNLTNSGRHYVATSGTTTVSARADVRAVGPSPFWTKTPTSWQPATDTGYVQANCSASSPTTKGSSVFIHNGVVDTALDADGYPTSQTLVENPAPGTQVPFTVDTVGPEEHGVMVFNEKIDHGDHITVNGSHMLIQGPFAFGDVIIAQVKCGHV